MPSLLSISGKIRQQRSIKHRRLVGKIQKVRKAQSDVLTEVSPRVEEVVTAAMRRVCYSALLLSEQVVSMALGTCLGAGLPISVCFMGGFKRRLFHGFIKPCTSKGYQLRDAEAM